MWIKFKPPQHLPFSYNIQSLLVRKGSNAMTLFSLGLTVMVFVVMSALSHGLEQTYASTGRDNVLIALSKGADSAEISRLSETALFTLKYHPAIQRRVDGSPVFSSESYLIKPLTPPLQEKARARWLPLRGLNPDALDLYPKIKLLEGRAIEKNGEIMVGKLVENKLGLIQVGDWLTIGRQRHHVVGIFSSNGSAYESEIWATNEDLKVDFNIPSQSIATFPIQAGYNAADVIREIESDPRLQVDLKTEKAYFSALAENYGFVRVIGNVIAIIMSIGTLFAGMNTMYASVSSRVREIGTLRAIGFSRHAIQLSFMLESLLLGALSGAIGCGIAILFNGASLSFMRSAFHIRVAPIILLEGFLLALFVSFIGGYFPAKKAAEMKIIDVMNG